MGAIRGTHYDSLINTAQLFTIMELYCSSTRIFFTTNREFRIGYNSS